MVQYGQGEIVYRVARNRSGNGGLIHRDDECTVLRAAHADTVLEKPLPSFPEYVPRCEECF